MHEYSIVQALLDRVRLEAQARGAVAVHRIRLRIGELSGVEIDLIRPAFEMIREGSVCAEAKLEIESAAARWECRDCDLELEKGQILRCPECARPAVLVQGDEIILEQLELEVP